MPPVRLRRSIAQLLHRPPDATVASVVRHQLAVQAQDYRCARLALRARTRGTTVADVDGALTEDRSILITWLNRGTLHLVDREDYPWLLGLTAPPLMTAVRQRLARTGVSPAAADRAVAAIDRALADEGPLTRHELGQRLESAGAGGLGSGTIQVLFLTGLLGRTIRGPLRGGRHCYVRPEDWLGVPAPATALRGSERDRAVAELARRYLRGHGPATDRDLATWAGLPLRDARAGLGAIARELVEGADGLVDVRRDADREPSRIPPRLLPMWDEMLVGWKGRAVVVPERNREAYGTNMNGVIRAIVCVGGEAVGTWGIRRDRGTVTVDVTPLEEFSATTAAGVERDVADVVRFERGGTAPR